ncbi:Regulator of G-protein signaling 4 [Echinococcus granulosus]|uniref:Regulator of G-protein signaling 4 n=1 Tax=Echinococcus granulosus TaxID=6210 RepID=W6UGC5_ECHGR|nr:Regulator of G-protein signaling 4 [Echinococcus granulosus]EUB57197.1 Regulator of G-protein signaling 4 [Echinococcus granulosus]
MGLGDYNDGVRSLAETIDQCVLRIPLTLARGDLRLLHTPSSGLHGVDDTTSTATAATWLTPRAMNRPRNSPSPETSRPQPGVQMKLRAHTVPVQLQAHSEMTMLRSAASPARIANNSTFLALQSTVRNCIPVVLPTSRAPLDLVPEAFCATTTTTTLKSLQRVSSDENMAASFRVKKVHLKKVTPEQIRRWETNFNFLLNDSDGLALFEQFLESEFSQENLQFWEACEQYRRLPAKMLATESQKIYQLYLSVQSPREVNLDSKTRLKTISLLSTPTAHLFDSAQRKIQALMEKDSYQRFLRAPIFLNFKKSVLANSEVTSRSAQSASPRHRRKPTHHGATSIHSVLPNILNVSALPLGRRPFE